MKRIILTTLLLACSPVLAQVPMTGAGKGTPAAAGSSFTGPGDCCSLTGVQMWWGLRAYSAAKTGTKAVKICDHLGNNCTDENTDSSGFLNSSTITRGSDNCAALDTCKVDTLYDQSGALACSGAACDLIFAGGSATRPTLTHQCANLRANMYCVTFTSANDSEIQQFPNTPTVAQTFSLSVVTERTGNTGAFNGVLVSNGASFLYAGSGVLDMNAGAAATPSYTGEGTFIAANMKFQGTGNNSSITVNGTTTSGLNTGTGSWQLFSIMGASGGNAFPLQGNIQEAGVWSGDQTSHFAALESNQRSSTTGWGF